MKKKKCSRRVIQKKSENEKRVLITEERKERHFCTNNLFSLAGVQQIDFIGVGQQLDVIHNK